MLVEVISFVRALQNLGSYSREGVFDICAEEPVILASQAVADAEPGRDFQDEVIRLDHGELVGDEPDPLVVDRIVENVVLDLEVFGFKNRVD